MMRVIVIVRVMVRNHHKKSLLNFCKMLISLCKKKSKELKELKKRYQSLHNSFEELKITHEDLKENHERLVEAHNSLKLEHEANVHIAKVDMGITCDLLDNIPCAPSSIIVVDANPSCSTSSPLSDDFTCGSPHIENETLRTEVDEFTHALSKCYVDGAQLRQCLGSQLFSLKKEGLGYEPKKRKKVFAQQKPSFVKSNGQ